MPPCDVPVEVPPCVVSDDPDDPEVPDEPDESDESDEPDEPDEPDELDELDEPEVPVVVDVDAVPLPDASAPETIPVTARLPIPMMPVSQPTTRLPRARVLM